jgi:hypothetical protein
VETPQTPAVWVNVKAMSRGAMARAHSSWRPL